MRLMISCQFKSRSFESFSWEKITVGLFGVVSAVLEVTIWVLKWTQLTTTHRKTKQTTCSRRNNGWELVADEAKPSISPAWRFVVNRLGEGACQVKSHCLLNKLQIKNLPIGDSKLSVSAHQQLTTGLCCQLSWLKCPSPSSSLVCEGRYFQLCRLLELLNRRLWVAKWFSRLNP